MKIAQLIRKMDENGVKLPERGTGLNGRILARDLENALGDYFFKLKYSHDAAKATHCKMRRAFEPMKAFRYDKLKPHEQETIFQDSNDWIGEKKFNGWRMVVTYIPEDGFCFWGGNISDVDFLPKDYTDHILLNGKHPRSKDFRFKAYIPFIFDSEALCYDDVEMLDGLFSTNTLDAVGAVLGSDPERAMTLQNKGAKLEFSCFDCILFSPSVLETIEVHPIDLHYTLSQRKQQLVGLLQQIPLDREQFKLTRYVSLNKKQTLNEIWKAGDEGMVFKNVNTPYVSGGRLRTHAIKVKRTMSGEIGDDIDAFIDGWFETKEWSKKGLIGGIKLYIFIEDGGEKRKHHIATVSAMPDAMREKLTINPHGIPALNNMYDNKVLVVDGQELSSRSRVLMHARVDWNRGFREDKSYKDCILDIDILKEEKF